MLIARRHNSWHSLLSRLQGQHYFIILLELCTNFSETRDDLLEQTTFVDHLHAEAKSRDHEILRAQKKCPKAVRDTSQNHVVWSRVLKYSVKSYVTALNQMLFQWILLMGVRAHNEI